MTSYRNNTPYPYISWSLVLDSIPIPAGLPRYLSPRLSLSLLAEVPVPSLVSLPTCRGTHPLICLSPPLADVPVPIQQRTCPLTCLLRPLADMPVPLPPPMRRCTCTCTRPQNGPMLASCLPPMSPPVPSVLPVSEHRSQSLNRNHVKCSEVH